ncbi:MAG: disulfide bond formation protein B [Patescibacteria group bacterium]
MFTTLVALGIIGLQIAIATFVVLWVGKSPFLKNIYRHSHIILSLIFIGGAFFSLIYEYGFGYEPCLLCWYQRIAIFGVALLSLTGDIRTNKTLQKQVLLFSLLGLMVAILHNYIDLIPSGLDICGTGPSCLKRYIYEFGYITIPMMSFTTLLSGSVLSFFLIKSPKASMVETTVLK